MLRALPPVQALMLEVPGYRDLHLLRSDSEITVAKGVRVDDGRAVVLKLPSTRCPSRGTAARLDREFEVASRLDSPHVVRCLGRERLDNRTVLVFEDTGGRSLDRLLDGGPLPVRQLLTMAIGLAKALASVHAADTLHRDVRPGNIIVDDALTDVRLTDFGIAERIARDGRAAPTSTGLRGSLAYLSPEQTGRINRGVDVRSDLYGVGVTLFEALTGRLPFEDRSTMALIHAHIARAAPSPVTLRPDAPPVLAAVLLRLLAKSPEDRYQTATGLAHDLTRCLDTLGPGGTIPAFALGEGDASDRLLLAQRLYGRERELARLEDVVARVSASGREMVIVQGGPGVGKSALVMELGRTIAEHQGLFLHGKFGQFQRGRPFSAVLDAFAGLANQLLALPDTELDAWRTALLDALGENAGLITDAIPLFARVMGACPVPQELSQSDAQNRFNFVFQSFVRTFCRAGAPLVLLLDDMQWADAASVQLVETVLLEPSTAHLVVLVSLRDTEVSLASPFPRALRRLEEARVPTDRIDLAPLGPGAIASLLSDTLSLPADRVAPLADIVHERTLGNPFFVNQILTHLHAVGVLSFDRQRGRWAWDEERVRALEITDNVVEFMTRRLLELSAAAQRTLRLAACLGSRFALTTLVSLVGPEAAGGVEEAVSAGLVTPQVQASEATIDDSSDAAGSTRFRFRHDRVHQAAYLLTPEQERAEVHLRIGRQLREELRATGDDDRIFDVVEHLQHGAARMDSADERADLARLHARAARRASDSLAFASAIEHIDHALRLLGPSMWSHDYATAIELHQLGAAAAVMTGQAERMSAFCDAVLLHGQSPHDKLPAWSVLINDHFSRSEQVDRALQLALDALESLGLKLPRHPTQLHTAWYLLRTKLAMRGLTATQLAARPQLEDPDVLAMLRVLVSVDGVAYMANPNSFAIHALTGVLLSLRHGHCSASGWAYNLYGAILAAGLGDIEGGQAISRFGYELARAHRDAWMENRIAIPYYITVAHWSIPMTETLSFLQDSVDKSMAMGSYNPAGAALMYVQFYRLFTGAPLGTIVPEQREAIRFADSIGQGITVDFTSVCVDVCADLLSSEPISTLPGETALAKFTQAANHNGVFFVHFMRTLHAWWLGDLDAALAHSDLARAHEAAAAGTILGQIFPFVRGVALTSLTASAPHVRAALREARSRLKTLRRWQLHCSHNLEHKADLVEAGIARLEGRHGDASRLFDRAHRLALQRGFIHEAAMAADQAARHAEAIGSPTVAAAWRADARYEYSRWGAPRVLPRFVTQSAAMLEGPAPAALPAPARLHDVVPHATIDQDDTSTLDVATILRSTDAVLREIDLDRLLATVMRSAIENAGAERGALLVSTPGGLVPEVAHPPSATPATWVAQSVVDYVRRSQAHIVIEDARLSNRFAGDAQIATGNVRSVLCIPLVNQTELIAILYLENNLAPAVFTPDRIELLTLLAAQAAISIRNAKLYRDQVRLTASYSRFVPKQFLQQLGRASIVDVALGDQVEMEMSVLFADIRGFSTLSERLDPAGTFAFLNEFLGTVSPVIREHGGFIDKYIGDAIMALFPGGCTDAARAAAAVHGALVRFNEARVARGDDPVRIGVGVHHGRLMLGTIGETERMEGTVISDAVNIAARLQELTKVYGARVLLSDRVRAGLSPEGAWSVRPLGALPIRGKRERVAVYELLDAESEEVRIKKSAVADELQRLLSAWEGGRRDEAALGIRELASAHPEDPALAALAVRFGGSG